MVHELRAPGRPVVRHVVTPDVELVRDPLLPEERREGVRGVERARRVLPHPLPDHERQPDAAPEPVEVVAVEVRDVVHRVVEVHGLAALAPAGLRDVVDAREAERAREEVGAAEREVRGVEGAQGRARERDVVVAAAVLAHPREDVLDDPVLEGAVPPRALLERHVARRPRPGVEAVDAVELHLPGLERGGDRGDHPRLLPVPGHAALRGEREERRAPVPEGGDVRVADPDVAGLQVHAARRRSARCGWSASRQPVHVWASRFSTNRSSHSWRAEGRREGAVVLEVLLRRPARDHGRHARDVAAPAVHAADEARDPGEPREPRLVPVEAAPEEAARLQEEAGEGARMEPVGVEGGQRAEARAREDGLALTGVSSASAGRSSAASAFP